MSFTVDIYFDSIHIFMLFSYVIEISATYWFIQFRHGTAILATGSLEARMEWSLGSQASSASFGGSRGHDVVLGAELQGHGDVAHAIILLHCPRFPLLDSLQSKSLPAMRLFIIFRMCGVMMLVLRSSKSSM